jgi:hypothetical protein
LKSVHFVLVSAKISPLGCICICRYKCRFRSICVYFNVYTTFIYACIWLYLYMLYMYTYILMVCFCLGVSWKCINFGCFRKFKSFQEKKSFRGILLLTLTLHPHRNRM